LVIKKKALDLLYKITNQSNIKSIVKELINYLLAAESEFKQDLCAKICQTCEKYAPNKKWHVDTVVKVLTLAEHYVEEEYISQIISVIATTPELHSYCVTQIFYSLKENINQIGLSQLGVWLIGEFGEILVNGTAKNPEGESIVIPHDEIIDLYQEVLEENTKKGGRSDVVICWSLTGLSKLSIRLPDMKKRIKELVKGF